jgi:hypothetical protein
MASQNNGSINIFGIQIKHAAPTKEPQAPIHEIFTRLPAIISSTLGQAFPKDELRVVEDSDKYAKAFANWTKVGFDPKDENNKKFYLEAVTKIRNKDEKFTKKCFKLGASKDRIFNVSGLSDKEYERMRDQIFPPSITFRAMGIKLLREDKTVMTGADVNAAKYEELQKQNKNTKTVEKSTITDILNNAEGLAKSSFGGVKNVVKAVSDSLDPNHVSWWRVKDVSDVKSPGQIRETFGLREGIVQRLTKRAGANVAGVKRNNKNPNGSSHHDGR